MDKKHYLMTRPSWYFFVIFVIGALSVNFAIVYKMYSSSKEGTQSLAGKFERLKNDIDKNSEKIEGLSDKKYEQIRQDFNDFLKGLSDEGSREVRRRAYEFILRKNENENTTQHEETP